MQRPHAAGRVDDSGRAFFVTGTGDEEARRVLEPARREGRELSALRTDAKCNFR